ncbi:MAG: 5-formyltetrahydrofolate cyclo-ligase [Aquificota bacterium]|nr:5-formyltetrahydrofolate cyclo-ligase [Aquificota bacterium]
MTITKEDLRRRILRKRIYQDPAEKERKDEIIRSRLFSLPEFTRAKSVLLYYPVKGEPDLRPLFTEVLKNGTLLLPKVRGGELALVKVKDPNRLRAGAFGIPEPEEGEEADPEEVELAVVPGVVFDRMCFRIGFGKGFYDRLLTRIRAPKVGVAYSFQVVQEVPRDPWDVPLDSVLTEEELIRRL